MKNKEMYKGFIFLGFKNLFNFGLHLGHIFKKSQFYARWFLQGICDFFFFLKSVKNTILLQKLNKKFYQKNKLVKHSGKDIVFLKKLYFSIFIIKLSKMVLGVRSLIFMTIKCGYVFGRG
jgi:hypothetical protein